MIYVFILFFIILLIITIKIRFEIDNLRFTTQSKKYINNNYLITIKLYCFFKIPIGKIKITQDKIEKVLKNKKVQQKIQKEKFKIIENRRAIDKEILKYYKNIKIKSEKMNLEICIGTENVALTAILVPIITSTLVMIFRKKLKRYNNNQILLVKPLFINQNILNISFSGIFEINLIHIINTICIVNKKRKGDKYERTSNRRSYDYGYEQY